MYLVYILKSNNLTYVGMTNNFFKRIRQHNKEIKGGARYTSKSENWYPICIIDGFKDKRSACQCEWRLKHGRTGKLRGANGRISYLSKFISQKSLLGDIKWTQKSEPLKDQNLVFYLDDEFINIFYNYNHSFKHKELYWK
tara:strand:+ start:170 stop:589 length:420 start_codon:yes stop_codon:yes gene_type:complete